MKKSSKLITDIGAILCFYFIVYLFLQVLAANNSEIVVYQFNENTYNVGIIGVIVSIVIVFILAGISYFAGKYNRKGVILAELIGLMIIVGYTFLNENGANGNEIIKNISSIPYFLVATPLASIVEAISLAGMDIALKIIFIVFYLVLYCFGKKDRKQ